MPFRSSPALACLLPLVLGATAAQAQTPAAASVSEPLGGPVIPGLCLLSREAVFANAAIGKAAIARLQQLTTEAQDQIDKEREPIDAELRAFQAEAAQLAPEQREAREQALATRLAPLQAEAQLRSREIEATRLKAMERISAEAQPVIAQVYRQKNCGLLVDRSSVFGGNFTNDLTGEVVAALDTRISTISFDREILAAAPAQSTVSAR